MKHLLLYIVCCSICLVGFGQLPNVEDGDFNIKPEQLFGAESVDWANARLAEMSLDQKIGQLLMVPIYSNKDLNHRNEIASLIENYHVGGLIFMKGSPVKQAEWTNYLQAKAGPSKLMIAIDGEWGISMRLKNTTVFPRQLTLGAIRDHQLVYDMGAEIARQCKRMGIHVNFAPVIDVNNNPNNPVINDRSFGENRYNVALMGLQYMKGLQDNDVIACAKHFPGHGDTDKDSHKDLPVIMHDKIRLDSIELFPFKVLMRQGLQSVMTAHLNIPSLDATPNQASSLSKNVVTKLLQHKLGFEGLIFTDALNMQGVAGFNEPGAAALKAFQAGNDILLFPGNIPKTMSLLREAVQNGSISEAELDRRVRKVLMAKAKVGLDNYSPIEIGGLVRDLNSDYAAALNQKLFENAITLVERIPQTYPLKEVGNADVGCVSIGAELNNAFQKALKNYNGVQTYTLPKNANASQYNIVRNQLNSKGVAIVSIHAMSKWASKNYGITDATVNFVNSLAGHPNIIVVLFGSPYALKYFDNAQNVLVAYQENTMTQQAAADVIYGGASGGGSLPITASDVYKYGMGMYTGSPIRMKYGKPESVGVSTSKLTEIDRIARSAIANGATPGCQVLVAKNGRIIYDKAFGHHTYDNKAVVRRQDLYDLASITKVAATTVSVMKLWEDELLDIDQTFGHYLPEMKGSPVGSATLRSAMTHTAGFKAWVPFWRATVNKEDTTWLPQYYRTTPKGNYNVKVVNGMYMRSDYRDSMFAIIKETGLPNSGRYKYSDLGFIMLRKIVEQVTKVPFDEYTHNTFYGPLKMSKTAFNPREKFDYKHLVPTQNDVLFRQRLVRGYVHDPGAAMLGGVSGHAGLFSNAHDVAVLMQMLLNNGEYGGTRYLKKSTIAYFTKQQAEGSRRGLGWDKPEPNSNKIGPTSGNTPLATFGHTGFTGTCVWADPENELIFVFLSNRIHPDEGNRKLIRTGIRTKMQRVLYEAI